MDVKVNDGNLTLPSPISSTVSFTGKFGYDKEEPSFYLNANFNVCNAQQSVNIDSGDPVQIPIELAKNVGTLAGSCANPANWFGL